MRLSDWRSAWGFALDGKTGRWRSGGFGHSDVRRTVVVVAVAAVSVGFGVGIGVAFYAYVVQPEPSPLAPGAGGADVSDIQMLKEVADELGRMSRQISRLEDPVLVRSGVDSLRMRLDALTRQMPNAFAAPAVTDRTAFQPVAPRASAPLPINRDRAALPAMWLAALISLSDPKVQDLDVALHQLDRIAGFGEDAFVAFYRGVIHYRKAGEAQSVAEAMTAYQTAIRLLETADAQSAEFANKRLRSVPFLPPERYVLEIKLTLGLAYYHLYSYARGAVREELAEGFRLNSRDNLIKYLRYARQVEDGTEADREAQAELVLEKLNG